MEYTSKDIFSIIRFLLYDENIADKIKEAEWIILKTLNDLHYSKIKNKRGLLADLTNL